MSDTILMILMVSIVAQIYWYLPKYLLKILGLTEKDTASERSSTISDFPA